MPLGQKEAAEKRREKVELEAKRAALKITVDQHRAANDAKPEELERTLAEATEIDEKLRGLELELQAAPSPTDIGGTLNRMVDNTVMSKSQFRGTQQYKDAFFGALANGMNDVYRGILDQGQERVITDLNTGSITSGSAYLMPTTTLSEIYSVITEYGALYGKVTKFGIRGLGISLPIGTQGAATAESNGTDTLNFTFTNADINQAAIVANIKVPNMLMHNGVEGLERYLIAELGKFLGITLEDRILNGIVATHKFEGIITAISTGFKTFSALTYAEFVGMLADVKAPYVRKGTWIMDSATYYGKVLSLTNAMGDPLVKDATVIQGGVSTIEPMLLGRPIIFTSKLPSGVNDGVIYGDLSQYIVNESLPFEMVSDPSRYRDEDATLIQGKVYAGGKCMIPTTAWAYRKNAV